MLVGLLRSRTIVAFGLSLLLAVIFLIFPLLGALTESSLNEMLFSHWAFGWTTEVSVDVVFWIGFFLTIASMIVTRIRFRETSAALGSVNLSSVVFLTVVTTQHKVLISRPDVLVAAFLMNLLYVLILYTYKRESVLSEMFHVGLLLGLASLFLGQNILALAIVLFALLTLRSGNVKEVIVLLLGLMMTLVFAALFLVWSESPFLAFQQMVQTSWINEFNLPKFHAGHAILSVAFLFSLQRLLQDLTVATVHERNVALVNVGWLVGVLLMVILFGLDVQSGIILTAFPLSTMLARSLESINRWWLADLILVLLIAAPFLRNLWQL